jgi:hypothetical protein
MLVCTCEFLANSSFSFIIRKPNLCTFLFQVTHHGSVAIFSRIGAASLVVHSSSTGPSLWNPNHFAPVLPFKAAKSKPKRLSASFKAVVKPRLNVECGFIVSNSVTIRTISLPNVDAVSLTRILVCSHPPLPDVGRSSFSGVPPVYLALTAWQQLLSIPAENYNDVEDIVGTLIIDCLDHLLQTAPNRVSNTVSLLSLSSDFEVLTYQNRASDIFRGFADPQFQICSQSQREVLNALKLRGISAELIESSILHDHCIISPVDAQLLATCTETILQSFLWNVSNSSHLDKALRFVLLSVSELAERRHLDLALRVLQNCQGACDLVLEAFCGRFGLDNPMSYSAESPHSLAHSPLLQCWTTLQTICEAMSRDDSLTGKLIGHRTARSIQLFYLRCMSTLRVVTRDNRGSIA